MIPFCETNCQICGLYLSEHKSNSIYQTYYYKKIFCNFCNKVVCSSCSVGYFKLKICNSCYSNEKSGFKNHINTKTSCCNIS